MAKTTKTSKTAKPTKKPAAKATVAKKTTSAKSTPAPSKAATVKVTVKGKTTVKVAPPAKKVVAAVPTVKAPVAKMPLAKTPVAVVKKTIEKEKPVAVAAPAPAPVAPKKPEKLDFTTGDFVVYPAHGVGYVEGVETQMIAGMEITLYTISFEKDRMRLKLPISKVKASGLRKLSSKDRLKDALATLQGRSQVRRVMWSRRAQEYEAKINSGDPVSIAEVLRDLKRDGDQSEQSYSERQIYQAALERLAREVAAIEKIDEKKAAEKLEAVLGNVA